MNKENQAQVVVSNGHVSFHMVYAGQAAQ